jgi:hypothetical protein
VVFGISTDFLEIPGTLPAIMVNSKRYYKMADDFQTVGFRVI